MKWYGSTKKSDIKYWKVFQIFKKTDFANSSTTYEVTRNYKEICLFIHVAKATKTTYIYWEKLGLPKTREQQSEPLRTKASSYDHKPSIRFSYATFKINFIYSDDIILNFSCSLPKMKYL